MKLVIDIPDDLYNTIKENKYDVYRGRIYDAIRQSTPLPEHHSDLIERSSLDVDNLDRAYGPNCELDFGRLYTQDVIEMIEKAPTIIPATKEGDGE